MLLEICAASIESALAAQRGGADRVELCDNLSEGGTTPGYGMISIARKNLGIKLHVMIRPRGGDFLYTDSEFEVMKQDITIAKQLGADGVVFGILTADGKVDVARTKELVRISKPLHVTFHRAFDMTSDPIQSLENVITCGADTLLSSGHQNKAADGIVQLKKLVEQAQKRIDIMVGSGVNENNIAELMRQSGATSFHLSAKKISESKMIFRKDNIFMGTGTNSEYKLITADEILIRKVKIALDELH